MPKISIVIPSMKHLDDCLRPCCESIIKHTDMTDVGVIVVLNGCGDDGSREYIHSLQLAGYPFLIKWLDEPSGYTHSTNVGIHASRGDYIILLNNDVVILGEQWINLLLQPFLEDPTVGLTGPLMLHCPDADEDFLVFFCAMISRVCLDAIGGELDEVFSPGYGEDCAAACEARKAGFKVLQVPPSEPTLIDKGCEDLPSWKRDKMWTNPFPCYHDGNKTFGEDPERFEAVLRKNKQTLQERYRVKPMPPLNLDRAKVIDGWFAESELEFVAAQAQHCKVVVEIGSWHGRSGRGIADNLPEGGVLYCVDTWCGSSGEPEMHGSAALRQGDHAHSWWWCNMHDLILAGKVIPVRMHSVNAAVTLKTMGVVADMIFVDADHSYEGVRDDVLAWRGLLREGGLFCGHDYYLEGQEPFAWMGVRKCINELFPDVQQALGTSIWHSRSKPLVKGITIDCIIVDDNLDAVEQRFRDTDALVDRWVIIEGKQTRDGQFKPLYFAENLGRFAPWLHKVTNISGFEFKGDPNDTQAAENRLWDAVTIGTEQCKDEDIIVLDGVGVSTLECKISHKEVAASSPSEARTRHIAIKTQVESQCDDPEYAKQVESSQRTIISEMFRDVDKESAILDVGCGTGVSMRILRDLGFTHVNGIDVAEQPALIADGFSVNKCDMHNIHLDDNSCNIVYASHSLEHAYDPLKVLAEFKRVLKPNGQLFVVLPYPDYIDSEHRARVHCGSEKLGLTVQDNGRTMIRTIEGVGFENTHQVSGDLRGEMEAYLKFKHAVPPKGRVIDTFIFNDELDVLDIRLATLNDTVDRFVLVEGTLTHSGKPKPLHFDINKDRYQQYLPKISHIIVDDYPTVSGTIYDQAWTRERHQRDSIMNGLGDCEPDDIILIGDADEIASPEAIGGYSVSMGLCRLKQRLFYYYLNCENKEGWDWHKIAPYSVVKALTPCGVRYPPAGHTPLIENGGWHFSFLGDAANAIKKVGDYAHREFDTPELMDTERVTKLMAEGKDIFGRDCQYEFVEIDEGYPDCIKSQLTQFIQKGLWRVRPPKPTVEMVLEKAQQIESRLATLASSIGPRPTVTAEVSTLGRYTTTLPMCLTSIITQTRKPDKLVIYDDGEQANLRELSPFNGLLAMCEERGIKWEVFATPRKGQVTNHQHALDTATTDFIWRVDDDEVSMPDCLERLLASADETVGAVGGLVLPPSDHNELPSFLDGSLKDIEVGMNMAWFKFNGGPREVQHLYSTFLLRVEAARSVGGYPKTLSVVGHREESIITHLLHRAGWKLLINPTAVTYHLRESTGGIRSFNDTSLWEHDEQIWQSYLQEWGANGGKPTKLIVLDCGIGDHFAFKSILPKLREIHADKELVLSVCFPQVFEGENLKLISIADAKNILGERYETDSHLYRWLWEQDWKGALADGMLSFWG